MISAVFALRPPPLSTAAMMRVTLLAMLPAAGAAVAVYGAGAALRLLAAVAAAAAAELFCQWLRRRPLSLADGSAAVTGVIIGVAVPPLSPWYVPVFAAAAGIGLAKHCYGGLGNNPFNPAMAGYALAFAAFPAAFGGWLGAADFSAAWESLFADGYGSPTPLIARRIAPDAAAAVIFLPVIAAAAGGVLLLALRVADWRLPLSFALGAAAAVAATGGDWFNLLHGGLVFAAFFVVTDPVTAAATPLGRWLYGGAVGALAVWLRERGAHADGIAFAVLFGNIIAPLFDLAARRR